MVVVVSMRASPSVYIALPGIDPPPLAPSTVALFQIYNGTSNHY